MYVVSSEALIVNSTRIPHKAARHSGPIRLRLQKYSKFLPPFHLSLFHLVTNHHLLCPPQSRTNYAWRRFCLSYRPQAVQKVRLIIVIRSSELLIQPSRLALNPNQPQLTNEQRAVLKANIQLLRDVIVLFTATGAARGVSGHTGTSLLTDSKVAISPL